MKRFVLHKRGSVRHLLVLTAAAALAAALLAQPISAGSSGVTLATGSFTLHGPDFGFPNGVNRTFAFTVHQSSDGTISGQVQVVSFVHNIVHGDINCFTLEGNQAIIGGTVTKDSLNPDGVGAGFAFAIQDNPDVSTFFWGPLDPPPCDTLLPALGEPDLATFLSDFGLPIGTGNIMIHQAN